MAKTLKTKKAFSKRIKVTGSGKVLKRRPHQDHFNAKESGSRTRGKRGFVRTPREIGRKLRSLVAKS